MKPRQIGMHGNLLEELENNKEKLLRNVVWVWVNNTVDELLERFYST